MCSSFIGNEICSFFIYDHTVLKREEDDLKDAIIYFYPHTVSIDNQCALIGKLIGISDFFSTTLPKASPKIMKFYSEKFATRHEGEFTIGLGCDLYIPDNFITRHLDFVWGVFVFFQGSLQAVRQRCKSHQNFPVELGKVWDLYLPICQFYGDLLSQAFQILPDVQLPKSSCKTFLHASHILQRSHRQPGVLGGAVLYRSKVLCTQLSPDVTKRFLLLKPQQSHLPCQEIKTDFELPGGMRLIRIYLSNEEYSKLGSRRIHSLKSKSKPSSQLLEYDTNNQISSDVALVPSLHCDSAFSPLQDGGQTGQEAVSDDYESPIPNQTLTEKKSNEPRQLESVEEVPVQAFGESGEITHVADHLEETPSISETLGATTPESETSKETILCNIKETVASMAGDVMDGASARVSLSKKGVEGDVMRVNGIRKSFTEDEVETMTEDVGTTSFEKQEDRLSGECDLSVTDSGFTSMFVSKQVTDADRPESKESDSCGQILESGNCGKPELNQCESKSEVSEIRTDSEKVETGADHEKDSTKTREDDSGAYSIVCDNNNKVDSSEGAVDPSSEGAMDPSSESEPITESSAAGEVSDKSNTGTAGTDSPNVSEEQREDSKQEQLSLTVSSEMGGTNTPESLSTSTSAPMVTSEEYSADDEISDHRTSKTGSNQSDSVTAVDSKTDTVSPLLKSHDDRHFVLSGGTVSSVSDDVMSSHKEMLDFSEDIGSASHNNGASVGWTVTTPLEEVKDGNFQPSSESYISSSYSHSESEASGNWLAERDGLVDLTLYVQGHSEMLLLLLLDSGVKCDKPLITELWRCSLAHLAELDYEVKETLESRNADEVGVGNYCYLRYDAFTRNVTGNVLESVAGMAHDFVSTSATIHDNFEQNETLTDVLLRSHSSSVYGHQSVCHETFFQLNAPQKHSGGYPQPKDIVFTLDQVAAQKLHTDHDITLL